MKACLTAWLLCLALLGSFATTTSTAAPNNPKEIPVDKKVPVQKSKKQLKSKAASTPKPSTSGIIGPIGKPLGSVLRVHDADPAKPGKATNGKVIGKKAASTSPAMFHPDGSPVRAKVTVPTNPGSKPSPIAEPKSKAASTGLPMVTPKIAPETTNPSASSAPKKSKPKIHRNGQPAVPIHPAAIEQPNLKTTISDKDLAKPARARNGAIISADFNYEAKSRRESKAASTPKPSTSGVAKPIGKPLGSVVKRGTQSATASPSPSSSGRDKSPAYFTIKIDPERVDPGRKPALSAKPSPSPKASRSLKKSTPTPRKSKDMTLKGKKILQN